MMRISSFVWIFCLVLMASEVMAQGGFQLVKFNQTRLDINCTGMIVLGSWAVVNLASSPILAHQSSGRRKHFHQMNGYWNTVNLGLAGFGLYSALTADASSFGLSQSLQEQSSMEKLLLLNAGLDVGYIMAGIYLQERGIRKDSDQLRGFGDSLILQGGFLLAFDAIFYLSHQHHAKGIWQHLDGLAISPNGFSLRVRL